MPQSNALPAARADSTSNTTLGVRLSGAGGEFVSKGARQRSARLSEPLVLPSRNLARSEVDEFTRIFGSHPICLQLLKSRYLFTRRTTECPDRDAMQQPSAHAPEILRAGVDVGAWPVELPNLRDRLGAGPKSVLNEAPVIRRCANAKCVANLMQGHPEIARAAKSIWPP